MTETRAAKKKKNANLLLGPLMCLFSQEWSRSLSKWSPLTLRWCFVVGKWIEIAKKTPIMKRTHLHRLSIVLLEILDIDLNYDNDNSTSRSITIMIRLSTEIWPDLMSAWTAFRQDIIVNHGPPVIMMIVVECSNSDEATLIGLQTG